MHRSGRFLNKILWGVGKRGECKQVNLVQKEPRECERCRFFSITPTSCAENDVSQVYAFFLSSGHLRNDGDECNGRHFTTQQVNLCDLSGGVPV